MSWNGLRPSRLVRIEWNFVEKFFFFFFFTWVSVSDSDAENSARSAMDRYCFSRNFFSRAISCWVVKGVRGLRLGLCLRNWQRSWPGANLGRPSRPPLCKLAGNLLRSESSEMKPKHCVSHLFLRSSYFQHNFSPQKTIFPPLGGSTLTLIRPHLHTNVTLQV